ncbi:MAG: ABC transporter ATP-binding protein, partial [Planctomycetota bacterium]
MSVLDAPESGAARTHAKRITAVRRNADEEQRQKPLDWRLIVRLYRYTHRHAALRRTLLAIVIVRAVQLPAVAWLMASIIHGPITDRNWPGTVRGALWLLGLVVFTEVTHRYRQRLALELGERVVQDFRRDIFAHLQRLSMGFYDRTKLGRIISRVTSDAEAVRQGVQDVLFVSLVQGG